MLGRIVATAALIALAGCAGMESAGRNASRSPEPARVASAPPPAAPAPAPVTTAALPPPQAAPSTPAPTALAPPSTGSTPLPATTAQPTAPAPQLDRPVTTAARDDDEVVVPGQRERQVRPPNGDPRSNAERMEDIRAWDQCVMRVQSAYDRDPMRPQLDSPEEYCSQSLGMAERTAIPQSRMERRP